MTNTVFYKKQGRKYVPVAEYDHEMMDSFPKGTHLVMSYPGGSSRRFNIDPAYAAMIAAGRVAEDAICTAMIKADEIKSPRRPMTQQEEDAWNNLITVWGDEARYLRRSSIREVAEAGIKAMQEEAEKLMENPAIKKAYERFLFVCELTKNRTLTNNDIQ